MLEGLGYQADIACDGLAALGALRCQHFDVILMDQQMPERDGLTAAQTIRSERAIEDQPRIILLSAMVLEGDRERLLETRIDYCLSLPLDSGLLEAALQ